MPTVDEEILAYEEELKRRREEERRRREEVKQAARQGVKGAGRSIAGKAVKSAGKKAAIAAGQATTSLLAASAPFIVPALIAILAIGFVIMIVLITLTASCYSENLGGRLGQFARSAAGVGSLSVMGGEGGSGEFCDSLRGLRGVVTVLDTGQLPPPGGEFCPRNIKPPAGHTIDCKNCVNLEERGIPVKPRPQTNPFADPRITDRLQRLLQVNNTFLITEAFCPTANHDDHDHYNGLAMDLRLKDEFGQDREKLAKLYYDMKNLGFSPVVCEFQAGYLESYGITCKTFEKTIGGHFHIEEPHAD